MLKYVNGNVMRYDVIEDEGVAMPYVLSSSSTALYSMVSAVISGLQAGTRARVIVAKDRLYASKKGFTSCPVFKLFSAARTKRASTNSCLLEQSALAPIIETPSMLQIKCIAMFL